MILWLAACDRPEEPPAPAPEAEVEWRIPLDDARLARRLSLDLRGVAPSLEELDLVEADPAALPELREQWMLDPRHEERLTRLYSERWHTRVDEFQVLPEDFGLPKEQTYTYLSSVGDEPLRLMAHVAAQDRPWTEIVTADWTMANATLDEIWPVDRLDPEAPGWSAAHYTDGRPAGGVLATNGLWFRYTTNVSNKNRGRVGMIARLLLCHDLLARPVSFQGAVSLADEDATATAIRTEPTCVACHSTVEPLAASLFGFWNLIEYNAYEMSTYHPERELLGEETLGVSPAFYGAPLGGFVDLGPAIANDPRFWRCAVTSHANALWRREVDDVADFDRISEVEEGFLAADLSPRQLIRDLTDTPEYRAGGLVEGAPAEIVERENTWRLQSPGQLATSVADLTGFVWRSEGFDVFDDDNVGFRVLAGGVDGYYVADPLRSPSVSWALATQRLAEAAADHVVRRELVGGGVVPQLLTEVTLDTRPTDPAFRAQLEILHRRMYATRADEAWLDAVGGLWEEVYATEGAAGAWTAVIDAMLRDPAWLGY